MYGGTGQFVVETRGGFRSELASGTTFPVRIVSADGNYILNTSVVPGQDIVALNIPNVGAYEVFVTDESNCNPPISITVTMTTESAWRSCCGSKFNRGSRLFLFYTKC